MDTSHQLEVKCCLGGKEGETVRLADFILSASQTTPNVSLSPVQSLIDAKHKVQATVRNRNGQEMARKVVPYLCTEKTWEKAKPIWKGAEMNLSSRNLKAQPIT